MRVTKPVRRHLFRKFCSFRGGFQNRPTRFPGDGPVPKSSWKKQITFHPLSFLIEKLQCHFIVFSLKDNGPGYAPLPGQNQIVLIASFSKIFSLQICGLRYPERAFKNERDKKLLSGISFKLRHSFNRIDIKDLILGFVWDLDGIHRIGWVVIKIPLFYQELKQT